LGGFSGEPLRLLFKRGGLLARLKIKCGTYFCFLKVGVAQPRLKRRERFEHLRFLQMTRRAQGRTLEVSRDAERGSTE